MKLYFNPTSTFIVRSSMVSSVPKGKGCNFTKLAALSCGHRRRATRGAYPCVAALRAARAHPAGGRGRDAAMGARGWLLSRCRGPHRGHGSEGAGAPATVLCPGRRCCLSRPNFGGEFLAGRARRSVRRPTIRSGPRYLKRGHRRAHRGAGSAHRAVYAPSLEIPLSASPVCAAGLCLARSPSETIPTKRLSRFTTGSRRTWFSFIFRSTSSGD